jgi:ABC-2 type transport system ATP-binding protein
MIEVSGLHKHFGPIRAVNGISFSIGRGEIVGFLGPNGAGKSTTMKILSCYIAPSKGAVRVAGYDIFTDSMNVRRRVGYLPEETPLYKSMTVIDFLKFVAAVREVPPRRVKERLRYVVEVCGAYEVLGQIIGTLSKGYRQRVGLAQALIHDPDILILDEPTSGLDPNQIIEIRNVIKELGQEKTLILSTHVLREVEATCDRVIIIDRGVVVGDGSQADLAKARKAQSGFMVTLDGKGSDMRAALEQLDGVSTVSPAAAHEGHTFIVTQVADEDPRLELMRLCVDRSWTILELSGHMASLEDIFRELTQRGGLATEAEEEDEGDEDEEDEDEDEEDEEDEEGEEGEEDEDEDEEEDDEEEEEKEEEEKEEEEKEGDGDRDGDDEDGDSGGEGDDGDEEKK